MVLLNLFSCLSIPGLIVNFKRYKSFASQKISAFAVMAGLVKVEEKNFTKPSFINDKTVETIE